MTRPSDWRERERCRDPLNSYIVQAPAGSGKTELLTQRMLGLLAGVEQPEEVVAITFTRKAALEMRHRLVMRLRDAAGPGSPLEPHEQTSRDLALAALKNSEERDWNLLEQPGRLRIRTIDSLCGELARQLPVLSGLGGGQQVTEDPESLYHAAAARAMAAIEDDADDLQPDVVRLLDRYDNRYDRLVGLLTAMLARRDQWLDHLLDLQSGGGFDRSGLEDSLRCLVEAELRLARKVLPGHLLCDLPRFLSYSLGHEPTDGDDVSALLDNCCADTDSLDLPASAESLPHWITMVNRLLTAKGDKWLSTVSAGAGFPPPSKASGEEKKRRAEWKKDFIGLLDRYRHDDELRERLNALRSLPRPGYDDEAWESLQSMMRVLLRATQEWQLVMAETGEADYSEIARRAIHALGGEDSPSDLALRMDYRIRHLLVDEFQDTSSIQIRLLNRLTAGWSHGDGRTLFLVGDPMQSIYRFRKAEVSLFIRAFEGRLFSHIGLQSLQLRVNFRSTRPVIDWVNRVFPVVMPDFNDPVNGAVAYRESSTRPGAPDFGSVNIRILPERDDEEEARSIANIVRACGAEERIALLVKSRKHAHATLKLLDRLKQDNPRCRYQAIDFNPLAETPLVQDLVSLTIALAQPADRLAWLSVLRAPFCGLDLADLDRICGGNPEKIIAETIAGSEPESISSGGRRRLDRVAPVLLEASTRRGIDPVRTLVESTWTRLGGPACVSSDSELEDATTFFGLLDRLEDEGLPIDRDTLGKALEKLYAQPDSLANGNLQVMTIYAAKGLQFDTVIVPGLNLGTDGDRGSLLHWFELVDGDRIVLSPMRNAKERQTLKRSGDLIRFISMVEKRRQALENGRLLYVAATRARHGLYLLSAIKPGRDGGIRPRSGTLMDELWPAIEEEQAPLILGRVAQEPAQKDPNEEEEPPLPRLYRRLDSRWMLPPPPEAVAQSSSDEAESRDYIEFRWAGEEARLTGNLVHRLLQLIAEQGIPAWASRGGMAGRAEWCCRQLLRDGVPESRAQAIIERASRAIDNCLSSDRGRWILDDHDDADCEYALTAVFEGHPVNLVLDRTFVSGGERWIVDYKSSVHGGGDLEGFLDNEVERYRDQLMHYRDAMAINERRPIRTALYFPLLDRFREV